MEKFTGICFFDIETTGLTPKGGDYKTDYMDFPYIVQLAWSLNGVEKEYIVRPDGWIIPDDAAAIHGITTKDAIEKGIPFNEIIREFIADCKNAKVIVGYNIYFDTSIIKANVLRMGDLEFFNNEVEPALDKYKRIDVMRKVIKFVDAQRTDGKKGAKFPKLTELYYKVFAQNYDGVHSALGDVQALIACMPKLLEEKLLELHPTNPPEIQEKMNFKAILEPKKEFTNEDRTRYFGICVGDIVGAKDIRGTIIDKCEVIELEFMNNNGIVLKSLNTGGVFSWVAEYCEIIKKVRDK